MLQLHLQGPTSEIPAHAAKPVAHYLKVPTSYRLFAIAAAIRAGFSVKKMHGLTGIDPWFLERVANIVRMEAEVRRGALSREKLLRAKQLGFSDARIALVRGKQESDIRVLRKKMRVTPSVFQIDTLAGEVPAQTNYLYLTYNGSHHDVAPLGAAGAARGKSAIVLGSGPYHIGSSVEFDWSAVNTALALRKHGRKAIIVNCNPETVSTDYDISDRLYFENLSLESVADIQDFEKSEGVIVSVGGQASNNLVRGLAALKIPTLGTRPGRRSQQVLRAFGQARRAPAGMEFFYRHARGGALRGQGRLPGPGAAVVRALRQCHARVRRRDGAGAVRGEGRFPQPRASGNHLQIHTRSKRNGIRRGGPERFY
jgi:carbamoyl-phosphate synthase large subunit